MGVMHPWRAALAAPCLLGLLLAGGCKEVQDIREELGWARQREAPPPPPVVTLADRWVPADTDVDALRQTQWTARWWQWAARFGADTGAPYRDPDGRHCALNQEEGAVWFLAGTDGRSDAVRTCTVPAGKHLFVPLINWVEDDAGRSCGDKQAAVARLADHVNTGLVLLDGRPIGQLERMRVAAGTCFSMSDQSPGAATDGYWLMLKPLPPGKHQLAIAAAYREETRQSMQNFRYELDVQAEAIADAGIDGVDGAGVDAAAIQ
ncbi:MAG TPA: hypothetical protein VGD42_21290 [Lysobacter sp.]